MKIISKAAAFCLSAAITLSAAGSCFAGEWKETENGKMYFSNDGSALKGFVIIEEETYYFDDDGIMKTGWVRGTSGDKYYFKTDGTMYSGWLKTKVGRYYFGSDGVMLKGGAKKIGTSYYFFNKDGVMQTGWQESGKEKYYYLSDGKRAVSRTVKIDDTYVKFDRMGKVAKRTSAKKEEESDKKKVTETKTDEKIIPTAITVSHKSFTVPAGRKFKITYNFSPMNTTCRDVTFRTSNSKVATIDEEGNFEAVGSGKCTITITSKEKSSVYVNIEITVTS